MADINLLRTFVTVYRTGSVTRAAALLHLTQPAVSMQVRALEESELGRRLFTRLPRGVEATAAARELHAAVAPHVDGLEEALGRARSASEPIAGTVFVGGPSEFMARRVLPSLADFVEQGLRIRAFVDVVGPIVGKLLAGDLDLAVLTSRQDHPYLETATLCAEEYVLVGAPQWEGRPADDLALVAYGEELPLIRPYWRAVFGRNITRRPAVVANELRALLSLATAGVGATVLPRHVCEAELERGELVQLAHPADPPRNTLYLSWRAGTLRHPRLVAVHERILQVAGEW